MNKVMLRAKSSLCRQITGCDGPMILPCGHKKDDPRNCEIWKQVHIKRNEFSIIDGKDFEMATKTFNRVKRELLKYINNNM
jgi:hypothetical protein